MKNSCAHNMASCRRCICADLFTNLLCGMHARAGLQRILTACKRKRAATTRRRVPLVQLELMSDDGLLVPREFGGVIFSAPGHKGRYKLECDKKKLQAMLHNDAEVVFVGRFREDKKRQGGEFTLHVTDFSNVEASRAHNARLGGAAAGDGDEDDGNAVAVYPQRCETSLPFP
jgi:hypothetical protein